MGDFFFYTIYVLQEYEAYVLEIQYLIFEKLDIFIKKKKSIKWF